MATGLPLSELWHLPYRVLATYTDVLHQQQSEREG